MRAGAFIPAYILAACGAVGALQAGEVAAPDNRFPEPVVQFDAPPTKAACSENGGCILVSKNWLNVQAKRLGEAAKRQAQSMCGSRV